MKEFAPAKVNLYLHVTGRRGAGYHLLDSLVVFADVGDLLEAEPDEGLRLEIAGPFAAALNPHARPHPARCASRPLPPGGRGDRSLPAPLAPSGRASPLPLAEEAAAPSAAGEGAAPSAAGEGAADEGAAPNLVLRAARALSARTGSTAGARLRLTKTLPVASGIGGGSSDAAATLRLLARLWRIDLSDADLAAIALTLGADVPACLAARPLRMGGVGEILAPAPSLPECGLVLLNPGAPVATADVFRARTGAFSPPASLPRGWADAPAMAASLAALRNDLQPPAVRLSPPIGATLAALAATPDCLLARMSGSGATCFGLFPSAAAASRAAALLAHPGWWSWGGALRKPAT